MTCFVYLTTATTLVVVISSRQMHRGAIRFTLGFLLTVTCLLPSDLAGIWAGQQQGRRGEPEDVAFRFWQNGQSITGKMFGDEFDIAIRDVSVTGEQVRFSVVTTNYYSGTETTWTYTGTVKGDRMELLRERVRTPEDRPNPNRPPVKQTVTLRRLT